VRKDRAEPSAQGQSQASSGRPGWLLPVAVGAVVLVAVGALLLVVGDGGDDVASSTSVPPIPSTDTAPSTTALTSTTSTSTSTTVPATTSTTSTTTSTLPPPTTSVVNGIPVFEPYEPLPGIDGVAALTGLVADGEVTSRSIIAVKVDNVRQARPQWGLEQADVIFEENVEQATRFVALLHSEQPDRIGPVRSARTGDIDILAGMNRPILAWSGGNRGVTRWIGAASDAGLIVDFTAQRNPCYARTSAKSAPHNLLLDPACARSERSFGPGAARPLWWIDADWELPRSSFAEPSTEFDVEMDGNRVTWRWDETTQTYLRFQNGAAHVTQSGDQLAFTNVIELYSPHFPSPVDGRSPNPLTTGRDRAVVHRAGTTIEGVWERRSPIDPFVFIDANTGELIALAPGTTFVEIVRNPAFG